MNRKTRNYYERLRGNLDGLRVSLQTYFILSKVKFRVFCKYD